MTEVVSSFLNAKELHQAWHDGSILRARQGLRQWLPLSLMAGIYTAAGSYAFMVLTSTSAVLSSPPAVFVSGIGLSLGLVFTIMLGAELFNGCSMEVQAVFTGRLSWTELGIDLTRKWFGNFVGIILFSAFVVGMGLLGFPSDGAEYTAVGKRFCAVASSKAVLDWWEIFLRGIVGAFIVCLCVLMATGAKTPTGKATAAILPMACGGVLAMEHCTENMFYFSVATMIKCDVRNHGYYWLNLLLTTLSNMLGAWFISFLYFQGFLVEGEEGDVTPPLPAPLEEPVPDYVEEMHAWDEKTHSPGGEDEGASPSSDTNSREPISVTAS